MIHRAVKLEYLDGVKVKLVFQDGKIKVYDMARLFDRYPQVKQLKDRNLFESGILTSYGVIWNDEIDIDCDTVYRCGEDIGTENVSVNNMIAYKVTEARVNMGLSQSRLAEITGIDQADISKIECGVANPSINTLDRIAKALGMSLEFSFR